MIVCESPEREGRGLLDRGHDHYASRTILHLQLSGWFNVQETVFSTKALLFEAIHHEGGVVERLETFSNSVFMSGEGGGDAYTMLTPLQSSNRMCAPGKQAEYISENAEDLGGGPDRGERGDRITSISLA